MDRKESDKFVPINVKNIFIVGNKLYGTGTSMNSFNNIKLVHIYAF